MGLLVQLILQFAAVLVVSGVPNRPTSINLTVVVDLDGGWSKWYPGSECSSDCLKKRVRICTNPSPIGEGAFCVGDPIESEACIGGSCKPVNGGWTIWSRWSDCLEDCFRRRFRTCTNPRPNGGGEDCADDPVELEACTDGSCKHMCANAGGELVNGQCLKFNKVPRLTYTGAALACAKGGQLASFDNNTIAYDYITARHNESWFRIGDSGTVKEGEWQWLDGRQAVITPWYKGEPATDPGRKDTGNTEYTITVRGGSGYRISSYQTEYGYICEIDL